MIIPKKPKAANKQLRGLDTSVVTKKVEEEDEGLDKFAPAKDSKDVRFQEFLNKELGTTDDKPSPAAKKSKVPDAFKNLYKLPDSIDYANYNQNREVIDRKHWLTGLAEVQVEEKDKPKLPQATTVNDVSKILNEDTRKTSTGPKR